MRATTPEAPPVDLLSKHLVKYTVSLAESWYQAQLQLYSSHSPGTTC